MKRALSLLKRCWPEALVVGVFVAILFAPSFDRREEAVAILKSDYYIIGNGVLVGIEREGKPRVALVTCRHVVESRMLTTGRSFLSRPSDENRLYFNKRGWGFWYKSFGNIDPKRWYGASDKDLDVAWIVLTDAEVAAFASGRPSYYRLPMDLGDETSDVLRQYDYAANNVDVGSPVKVVHMGALVTGPKDPHEKTYWWTFLPIPHTDYMWANVYGETGDILAFNVASTVGSIDARGEHSRQQIFTAFAVSAHDNMSGSPVFAHVGNDLKLLGITTVSSNDGNASYQSLDGAIAEIRASLENGK